MDFLTDPAIAVCGVASVATAAFAVLDPSDGVLPYVNAGGLVLAFVAIFLLHRDHVAAHRERIDKMLMAFTDDRKAMVSAFREELQLVREDSRANLASVCSSYERSLKSIIGGTAAAFKAGQSGVNLGDG